MFFWFFFFFTFEPVSSVEVLASENQREEEDGQQAQWANQHSAQIHIYKNKQASDKWHYRSKTCVCGKVKQKRDRRQEQYLQINATVLRWCRPQELSALWGETFRKSANAVGGKEAVPRRSISVVWGNWPNAADGFSGFQKYQDCCQDGRFCCCCISQTHHTHTHTHTQRPGSAVLLFLDSVLGVPLFSASPLPLGGRFPVAHWHSFPCVLVSAKRKTSMKVVVSLRQLLWTMGSV